MRRLGQQRISKRHEVVTTPIRWMVPRRKRRSTPRPSLSLAEAAIVEMSVMGAAIVAPEKWEAVVGTKVEVFWEDLSGTVLIRRAEPYRGSENLYLYGVEWVGTPSILAEALYDRLVHEHPEPVGASSPIDNALGQDRPITWAAPVSWGSAD